MSRGRSLGGEHVGDEVEHRVDFALVGVDLGQVAYPPAALDLVSRSGVRSRERPTVWAAACTSLDLA